jgi:hypothetical protein
MQYLTILNYTTGTTIIIPCPVFDNEANFSEELETWLQANYPGDNIYYMVCNNLEINL